jgi:hypothetical protein
MVRFIMEKNEKFSAIWWEFVKLIRLTSERWFEGLLEECEGLLVLSKQKIVNNFYSHVHTLFMLL